MPDWFAMMFLALLGACVGSFLNVVIYRLPKGDSIVNPPSHCTNCNRTLCWYENIPVLSYLVLGGRCKTCKTPISPRYALVELITAVLFVALYDAFYKCGMHSWFGEARMDWPIFVAHLALVAVLIVCSVVDLEFYLIDVRIAWFAMFVGIAAWMGTPAAKLELIGETKAISPSIFAGLLGMVVVLLVQYFFFSPKEEPEIIEDEAEESAEEPVKSVSMFWPVLGLSVYAIGSFGLILWGILGESYQTSFTGRGLSYVGWAFLTIIIGGIPRRQSDKEIVEIIEEEKSGARKMAIKEFFGLLPPIVGFWVFWAIFRYVGPIRLIGEKNLFLMIGPTMPLVGLYYALAGILVAAAFGWTVRILFTLVFGKEAMGTGDIYILAAIGAIAGIFVTILGFFLGSVIGVLGIVVLLLWKTSRALSYGPWIAIGALLCMLFYNPIANYVKPAMTVINHYFFGGAV
jgi:prepilin signal peptidase PulO-like enzyme (type II secretory pathway)